MRKRLNAFSFLRFILIAVCSAPLSCDAQSPPLVAHPHISSDAYEHILDEVFAHKEPGARQLQYSLVLRFMTSKHAESEFVLFVLRDGTAQGNLFQVSGSSVWTTANEYIQKHGTADVLQIAKQVHVAGSSIPISQDQASLWYSSLLRNIERSTVQLQQEMVTLKKTDETTVFLDGSTYELWFDQGMTDIHWTVMDEEVDNVRPAGHSPIARWMNDVRQYTLRHTK